MDWNDVLNDAAAKLDAIGIQYAIVGSCASMAYGEVRFTQDVDILADVRPQHIPQLLTAFPPPEYYLSLAAIEQALRQRTMFNIIYPQWGIKVDIMLEDDRSRELNQLERSIFISRSNGARIRFAAPEDIILKKLEYFQLGGSEKHLRDIAGMLKLSTHPIDREYITRWADKLGAQEVWQLILEKVSAGR